MAAKRRTCRSVLYLLRRYLHNTFEIGQSRTTSFWGRNQTRQGLVFAVPHINLLFHHRTIVCNALLIANKVYIWLATTGTNIAAVNLVERSRAPRMTNPISAHDQ